jgi:SAM-dependent methyltransferase
MVREQWSAAAEAWRAQHEAFTEMSKHVTIALVDAANLAPGQQVLDLAGGTGEPALSVAKRVAPGGSVVCTDLAAPMLEAAEHFAKQDGVDNMTFQIVDMEDIPFEDDRFDRVTCRFGIMFPTDPPKAMSEIRRVLKPGGQATFAVWASAAENPNFLANSILGRHGLLQPPPPGVPTPFAYAEYGSLSGRLREAGFNGVQEEKRDIEWVWPGTVEEQIEFMRATLPNVRKALDEAPPTVIEEIKDAMNQYREGDRLNLGARIYIVSATK